MRQGMKARASDSLSFAKPCKGCEGRCGPSQCSEKARRSMSHCHSRYSLSMAQGTTRPIHSTQVELGCAHCACASEIRQIKQKAAACRNCLRLLASDCAHP